MQESPVHRLSILDGLLDLGLKKERRTVRLYSPLHAHELGIMCCQWLNVPPRRCAFRGLFLPLFSRQKKKHPVAEIVGFCPQRVGCGRPRIVLFLFFCIAWGYTAERTKTWFSCWLPSRGRAGLRRVPDAVLFLLALAAAAHAFWLSPAASGLRRWCLPRLTHHQAITGSSDIVFLRGSSFS